MDAVVPDGSMLAGILIALPSLLAAYWAYRRGKNADDHAAQMASNTQVYGGFAQLLQSKDADIARKDAEIAHKDEEIDDLRQRNAELERRERDRVNGIRKDT